MGAQFHKEGDAQKDRPRLHKKQKYWLLYYHRIVDLSRKWQRSNLCFVMATSREKRSVQSLQKVKTALDNSQAVHYTNDTKNMVTVAQ